MSELIQAAIHWSTLPLTVMLGLVVFYWLLTILGAIDLDGFDFDFDTDTDIDADLDVDADGEMQSSSPLVSFPEIPLHRRSAGHDPHHLAGTLHVDDLYAREPLLESGPCRLAGRGHADPQFDSQLPDFPRRGEADCHSLQKV